MHCWHRRRSALLRGTPTFVCSRGGDASHAGFGVGSLESPPPSIRLRKPYFIGLATTGNLHAVRPAVSSSNTSAGSTDSGNHSTSSLTAMVDRFYGKPCAFPYPGGRPFPSKAIRRRPP